MNIRSRIKKKCKKVLVGSFVMYVAALVLIGDCMQGVINREPPEC